MASDSNSPSTAESQLPFRPFNQAKTDLSAGVFSGFLFCYFSSFWAAVSLGTSGARSKLRLHPMIWLIPLLLRRQENCRILLQTLQQI
ncbi:MAG: hypothetical protein WDN67_03305 [Candidatus Moraniibacteriota bacterium]